MSKITKFARGKDCTVMIPGVCNFDPATSVLAHRNGCGWNSKCPDDQGAICCSSCHDVVDGRNYSHSFALEDITLMFYEGVFRTQELLKDEGLIVIKG